jgi:hypothetical protein
LLASHETSDQLGWYVGAYTAKMVEVFTQIQMFAPSRIHRPFEGLI